MNSYGYELTRQKQAYFPDAAYLNSAHSQTYHQQANGSPQPTGSYHIHGAWHPVQRPWGSGDSPVTLGTAGLGPNNSYRTATPAPDSDLYNETTYHSHPNHHSRPTYPPTTTSQLTLTTSSTGPLTSLSLSNHNNHHNTLNQTPLTSWASEPNDHGPWNAVGYVAALINHSSSDGDEDRGEEVSSGGKASGRQRSRDYSRSSSYESGEFAQASR